MILEQVIAGFFLIYVGLACLLAWMRRDEPPLGSQTSNVPPP